MAWFQFLALFGVGLVFFSWLTVKFPNKLGGDALGAAMLAGFFAVAAFVAFVSAAIGWAFN